MATTHLKPALIDALRRGRVASAQEEALRSHLGRFSRCRAMVERIRAEDVSSFPLSVSANPRVIPREAYARVLEMVFDSILEENEKLEGQRANATDLVRELKDLGESQRQLLIRNSPRYQAWPLAEELLAHCREGWAEDPLGSQALAKLAFEISELLVASGFRARLLNDLKAQAWSYVGNCYRIDSDLESAAKAFRRAESYLAQGSGDPMERARLLDLKSSLFRARRDFRAASALLAQVINQYQTSEDKHLEGRALLKQSKFLRDSGRVAESILPLERAASLLDAEREPRALLALKNNLVIFHVELGQVEEAVRHLPDLRELARQHGSRHDRLRVLWVEGVLCKSLGQTELALEALKQVREGFIAAGIGYDVALVSLDLAALYLESGHRDEVRKLVVESMPLFVARRVHREVLMAWSLLREAAERDVVTLSLVQEVASRIRHAQSRPNETADIP